MRWRTAGSPRAAIRRRPPSSGRSSALLSKHDATALQNALANLLMRQGLQRFVLETLTSLNHAVGDAWMRGELAIFEEHLYSEQLHAALRTAINAFPRQAGTPKVLLTTFPGEQHGMGLLMVEALLGPGRRAMHFAGRADTDRGCPARRARARSASRRAVVLGSLSAAPGGRRTRRAAPAIAAEDRVVGRRRNDPPDTEGAAGRHAGARRGRDDRRIESLARIAALSPPSNGGAPPPSGTWVSARRRRCRRVTTRKCVGRWRRIESIRLFLARIRRENGP